MGHSPETKEEQIQQPTQGEFVEVFSEKLTDEMDLVLRQNVAIEIYNVLFGIPLDMFDKNQFSWLSTLMHSKQPEQSEELLKEIVTSFPQTWEYLRNLYKHKILIPKKTKDSDDSVNQQNLFPHTFEGIYGERINILKNIKFTLFEVFSVPWSYDIFQKAVWNWYISYLQKIQSDKTPYIQQNVSMMKYNPLSWEMLLGINSDKDYDIFEDNYLASLKSFLRKWLEYKFTNLEYNYVPQFSNNSSQSNTSSPKKPAVERTSEMQKLANEKIIDSVREPLNARYTWESFHGKQKEQLKELIEGWKNIFVWGNDALGKSHLIQAVIKKLQTENYWKKIVYTTWHRLYSQIQSRAAENRIEQKGNMEKKDKVRDLYMAFDENNILIVDDVDVLWWSKTYSQDVLNKIFVGRRSQIVFVSSLPPAQIQWHNRISLPEWWADYIQASLVEKFSTIVVPVQSFDPIVKKQIARDIWQKKSQPNLFMDQSMVSWLIDFMTEHISPKVYPQLIDSILMDNQSADVNVSQKIYNMVENITGKTILPSKDEIVNIIVEEFNLDDIDKYINRKLLSWWTVWGIEKQKICNDKHMKSDSIEWVILRLCIYFIKKYYPKESFDAIWEKFNRTNAANLYKEATIFFDKKEWTESFYKEAKEWLLQDKPLEKFLDNQIKWFLKKKYWLQHTI